MNVVKQRKTAAELLQSQGPRLRLTDSEKRQREEKVAGCSGVRASFCSCSSPQAGDRGQLWADRLLWALDLVSVSPQAPQIPYI